MKYQIFYINRLKLSLLLLVSICSSINLFGQDKSLEIGDAAPELKYSKWIKGTPVTNFENDQFYVVEFWATWCGPCKAAMPHLSELAKKYKDKATFIGMNIWEKTGEKPYESSLPEVIKYVNSVGDNMAYNVAADNNDKFMVNNWMLPAGQMGIPATFLIKDGKIIWIGHPMAVDSIMNAAIKGTYDIETAKQNFRKSKARSEEMKAKFSVLEPIQKAYAAKDYQKALTLLNDLDESDPMMKMQKKSYQFYILIEQKKEAEAIAFGEAWVKENSYAGQTVAMGIMGVDGLSKKAYLYAAFLYKELLKAEGTITPFVHDGIATAYDKAGDLKTAILEQEIAVKEAKDAVKEKKFIGSITSDTISEFEKKLATYNARFKAP